jgi:hypothetical protein
VETKRARQEWKNGREKKKEKGTGRAEGFRPGVGWLLAADPQVVGSDANRRGGGFIRSPTALRPPPSALPLSLPLPSPDQQSWGRAVLCKTADCNCNCPACDYPNKNNRRALRHLSVCQESCGPLASILIDNYNCALLFPREYDFVLALAIYLFILDYMTWPGWDTDSSPGTVIVTDGAEGATLVQYETVIKWDLVAISSHCSGWRNENVRKCASATWSSRLVPGVGTACCWSFARCKTYVMSVWRPVMWELGEYVLDSSSLA